MNEKINRRRIVHCVRIDMVKLWGGITTNLSSNLTSVKCGPKPSSAWGQTITWHELSQLFSRDPQWEQLLLLGFFFDSLLLWLFLGGLISAPLSFGSSGMESSGFSVLARHLRLLQVGAAGSTQMFCAACYFICWKLWVRLLLPKMFMWNNFWVIYLHHIQPVWQSKHSVLS